MLQHHNENALIHDFLGLFHRIPLPKGRRSGAIEPSQLPEMGGWPEEPKKWNRYKRLVCFCGFKSLLFNFYEKSEMKKSLIALAVLAASGASFAQVSITGNLTYGYQSTTIGGVNGAATAATATSGASGDTSGFGAETANVLFTAKEDLGGGYSATASLKLKTGATTGTTGGNSNAGGAGADDHTLTLVTPGGAVTLGTMMNPDYLSGGIAGVGAYYNDWATTATAAGQTPKLFTQRQYRDFFAYTVPVGAVTLTLAQYDAVTDGGFGAGVTGGSSTTGAGFANSGSNSPLSVVSATYTAGPLVANGQYAVYRNAVTNTANPQAKDTTRLSASYDLGMAKLGGGVVITNLTPSSFAPVGSANPKVTDYLLAAKIPMGASSFGLSFASRNVADVTPGTSTTGTGYSLEYGYAMSKRTSVIANYARWTGVTGAGVVAGQDASSQYNLLLAHSF